MSLKNEINKLIPAELKAKIKELSKRFNAVPGAPPAPEQPPVQLQESTLADGTVIKYNTPTLAVGSEVTVVSPEGEMPAPEGEHTLQDGTVIVVVNAEGKSIVESVTPGAGAPPAPVVQSVEDPHAKIMEIAKLLNGFQEDAKVKFSTQEKEKETLTKKVDAQEKELSELKASFAAFVKVVDEVFSIPSTDPVETPKNKTVKKRAIDAYIALADKNK